SESGRYAAQESSTTASRTNAGLRAVAEVGFTGGDAVCWRRSGSPAVTLRVLEHLLLHPSPLRGEQRNPGGGESRERCTEPCDRPAPPWDRQHGSWLVQYLANRPHHVLGLEQHTGE